MPEITKKKYEILSKNDTEVIIKYYDSLKLTRHLKVVTIDSIKDLVEKGESICLNNCYIMDFSYAYVCGLVKNDFFPLRSSNEINTTRKPLINFEAKNAFFDGNIDFEYAYFKGDASFRGSYFGNNVKNFCYSYFEDCKIDFVSVYFGDAKVDFESAKFDGYIDFSFSSFGNGLINFENTQFGEGEVSFDSTTFSEGNLSFKRSVFGKGKLSFDSTHFLHGDTFFKQAKFTNTYIQFNSITSEENNFSFSNAEFKNVTLVISNTNFNKIDLLFSVAIFNNTIVDFFNVNIHKQISFDNSLINDSVFMFHRCSFYTPLNIDLKSNNTLVFYRCTNNDLINIYSRKSDYIKNRLALFDINNMGLIQLDWDNDKYSILDFDLRFFEVQRIYPDNMKDFRINCCDDLNRYKTKELCMLKEIYHNQGRYDWEDESYVQFKRLDSKQLPKSKFIKKTIYTILFCVGKYGTDPFSIFISMLAVVVLFGLIFMSPLTDISPQLNNPPLWSPFYYSIITFFTIGYGDLYAQDWFTAILCGIEGFLGVFLMSYFSVSLVRKILR